MKILQKFISVFLSSLIMLISYGVSFINPSQSEVFSIPVYPQNQWQGNDLTINGKSVKFKLEKGQVVTNQGLPVFSFDDELILDIHDNSNQLFNYYGLSLHSSVPLKGTVTYSILGVSKTEEFFIEKSDKPVAFFSFIDGYFKNLKGFNISKLSFTSLAAAPAQLTIAGIAYYNRKVFDDTVFISDANYKLGASLKWGGALSYLEYLKENVQAVRTKDDVVIGIDSLKKYGGDLITDKVNLINRADTGRLVQQSYYGTNGENDDYEQGEYMGNKWSYNPVQGGNRFNDASKIVDCRVSDNAIYIKCRPMDWAKPAKDITPSYMEATYTLKDGYVRVDCRFVDFSKWESVYCGQELPAFYVDEPLNSFRYYGGSSPWSNDAAIKREDNLIFWPDAGYPNFNATENWCAWTNLEDDGFGLGLYVPGISKMLAGVASRGGKIGDDPSTSGPTSYVAALKELSIKSFVPLEYGYLIAAGKTSEIRQTFMQNKDTINNNALMNY